MRIIVGAKQVPDFDQVRMNRESREPSMSDVPLIIGILEKNALQEASSIKERLNAEVVALSVGWPDPETTILECLGRGADRAIGVVDLALEDIHTAGSALVVAKAIEKIGGYDLILFGEGSSDNNSGQMGPMVARILGLPLLGHARRLEIIDNKARVQQSLEDCFTVIESQLPAVVTVTGEINEPNIPSIIEVMEASSKPHENWSLADIGLNSQGLERYRSRVISNRYPEQTRKNIMLEGGPGAAVDKLLQNLSKEAVLER